MKDLIQHLWSENREEIVERSLRNCHAHNLDSIMLLDTPGRRIRLFVAHPGHDLWRNKPDEFKRGEKLSIAFHAHHCNITIKVITGALGNWLVWNPQSGPITSRVFHNKRLAYQATQRIWANFGGTIYLSKFRYVSGITNSTPAFIADGHKDTFKGSVIQLCNAGPAMFMSASMIHTVAVRRDESAAWLIFEGQEDSNYESVAWSNADLTQCSFDEMYKRMSESEICSALQDVGLLK